MNQSHVYLESIKHLATKHWGLDIAANGSGGQTLVHFLARHSPYVGTRVQRVPIPDKYVAWEVMWIDYDPVAYSMPKMDFPSARQSVVDEDILLLQELQVEEVISKLPVLQWNARCVNPAGITIDRLSWIRTADAAPDGSHQHVLYKLDNGIPLNPIGRTGLRGRGALHRWGPNHYVILIITRWQSLKTSNNVLEFVVEKTERRDQLSLPSRFVGGECLYLDLQTLFKAGDNWTTSAEMIDFFRAAAQPSAATFAAAASAVQSPVGGAEQALVVDPLTGLLGPAVAVTPGFKYERVTVGYLDDPYNTDNAWKEMELWHIHYTDGDCLADRMHSAYCHWRKHLIVGEMGLALAFCLELLGLYGCYRECKNSLLVYLALTLVSMGPGFIFMPIYTLCSSVFLLITTLYAAVDQSERQFDGIGYGVQTGQTVQRTKSVTYGQYCDHRQQHIHVDHRQLLFEYGVQCDQLYGKQQANGYSSGENCDRASFILMKISLSLIHLSLGLSLSVLAVQVFAGCDSCGSDYDYDIDTIGLSGGLTIAVAVAMEAVAVAAIIADSQSTLVVYNVVAAVGQVAIIVHFETEASVMGATVISLTALYGYALADRTRRLAAESRVRKEELKGEESNIAKKEWEAVQTITEEIEHEKKV
ncbi:unnamed protein product, partial [Medioppia subpectinata]